MQERMFLETLLSMSEETREKAFEVLKKDFGFSDELIEYLKTKLAFYHLFSDEHFYNSVRSALCETVYKEITRKELNI